MKMTQKLRTEGLGFITRSAVASNFSSVALVSSCVKEINIFTLVACIIL